MNPKHQFEVYTSTDKAKRDELFQALRNSDDPFERQVVKFSGNRPVIVTSTADFSVSGQLIDLVVYTKDGTRQATGLDKEKNKQHRPRWESTWSVAHPKQENL